MKPDPESPMPMLELVSQEVCESLAQATFGGLGCEEYGVAMLHGASSWEAHETGDILVPRPRRDVLRLRIAYDGRGAPYVVTDDGAPAGVEPCANEDTSLKISLADEGDFLACVWARTTPGSSILGVGVDLVSTSDFGEKPSAQRFIQLLFTQREREMAPLLFDGDVAMGYAALFGAKEAAFKATAQQLRAWYRTHDEELAFEVRHFSATAPGLERGEERNAAAQRAMDAMGITRIEWHAIEAEGMALVVACALA